MKRITSFALIASFVGVGTLGASAHADEIIVEPAAPPPVYVRPYREHYYHRDRYDRPGLRLERAGVTLAVIGSVLVVAGTAAAANAFANYNHPWQNGATVGAGLAIPGAVLMTMGIPMWAVGDAEGHHRVEVSAGPTGVIGRF